MTIDINENAVGGSSSAIVESGQVLDVAVESPLQGTLQSRSVVINDASRKRVIFDPPIKGTSIKVRHANATAITLDQGILLTVDAVNEAVADIALDESQVGVRLNIMPDDTFQEIVFDGALVSNIDMKGIGDAPDLVVTLGGVY